MYDRERECVCELIIMISSLARLAIYFSGSILTSVDQFTVPFSLPSTLRVYIKR